MKFKTLLFGFIALVSSAMLGVAEEEHGVRIVAMVADVWGSMKFCDAQGKVIQDKLPDIEFIVNSPTDLMGAKFRLVVPTIERAKLRTKYPVGSLWTMSVSKEMLEGLNKERKESELFETQIDSGVNPVMISQTVIPPQLRIEELQTAPTIYSVTGKDRKNVK